MSALPRTVSLPLAAQLWLVADAEQLAADLARFAHVRYSRGAWSEAELSLGRYGYLLAPRAARPAPHIASRIGIADVHVVELHAPVERAKPSPISSPIADAYPAGPPKRAERRHLEWLIAVSERLGGVVEAATGALIQPVVVPEQVTLTSAVWVTPNAIVKALSQLGSVRFAPRIEDAPGYLCVLEPVDRSQLSLGTPNLVASIEVSAAEGVVTYFVRELPAGSPEDVYAVVYVLERATRGQVRDRHGFPLP